MHEVFLSERIDVAVFLIERNVSIDIAPVCGITVRKLVYMPTLQGPSSMHGVIWKYITKIEKEQYNRCHGCNKIFDKLNQCNRCKKAFYCSKECQKKHWRKHKAECRFVDDEYSIQLSKPDPNSTPYAISSKGVSFERPNDVEVGERFWIKVQCLTESNPHLVYDRSRSCSFSIMPRTPGHVELHKKVQDEKAFNGSKLYFKAAFDASGNFRVYPNICSTSKTW